MIKKRTPSDRLTIRLGSLAKPLADYCEEQQQTPADVGREAIAEKIGADVPVLSPGNPNAATQAIDANKARWKKRRRKVAKRKPGKKT